MESSVMKSIVAKGCVFHPRRRYFNDPRNDEACSSKVKLTMAGGTKSAHCSMRGWGGGEVVG